MTPAELLKVLGENIDKPVLIHFTTGGEMSAIIVGVDDEGFVSRNITGPTTDVPSAATLVTLDGQLYWSRFEWVANLVPIPN